MKKHKKHPKKTSKADPEIQEAMEVYLRAKAETPMLLFEPYSEDQKRVLTNEKNRMAVLAGNRMGKCVAADTIVAGRRIDSFGFLKGTDQLWDIGGRLRATESHRVLSRSGWTSVSELLQLSQDQRRVFVEVHLPTNLESSLLAHGVDDPSSWQRAEDFQSDYLAYFHSRGGQPQHDLIFGQDGVPSPNDVDAGRFSHQYEREHSHLYPGSLHPSSFGGDGLLLPSYGVEDPDVGLGDEESNLRILDVSLSDLPSDLSSKVTQQLKDQNLSSGASEISLVLWCDVRAYAIAVNSNVTITKDKVEAYYDTNIPFTHSYVSGGLISHNTTIGMYWFLCHLSGEYPDYWPTHMRFKGPIRARILIEEYRIHGAVIMNKLREMANRGFIKKRYKNPQGYCVGFECSNGAEVQILTHVQSSESQEGWDGHVVWADEPPPKDQFIASVRGLIDHNGQYLNTMTPLKEPWISDEIFEENPELWNVINLEGANPYIDQQALENFFKSVDPDQLEARKHGKFVHLSGAIYHMFTKQKHVVPSKKLPDHWPRFNVVDPHDRRPFAMGWYAVDPMNRIWVYDEYPNAMFHKISNTDMKTEDFAVVMRTREGKDVIAKRIIDRRYGVRRSVGTGRSIQEELNQDYDLYFNQSYDDTVGGVEAGHIAVKDYLGRHDQEPRFFIMEHCVNHIYAMTHYIYDDKTGKPKEHGKDFADIVRYMCADRPDYDMWQSDPSRRSENIELEYKNEVGRGEPVDNFSSYETHHDEY